MTDPQPPPLIVTCKKCGRTMIFENRKYFLPELNLCVNCYRMKLRWDEKTNKNCPHCNKELVIGQRIYCSDRCRIDYHIEMSKKRERELTKTWKSHDEETKGLIIAKRAKELLEEFKEAEGEQTKDRAIEFIPVGERHKPSVSKLIYGKKSKKKQDYFTFKRVYDKLIEEGHNNVEICKILRVNPLRLRATINRIRTIMRNPQTFKAYQEYLKRMKGGMYENGKKTKYGDTYR
jgi:endogenous inhibitor of DNA gyrase (YacG/DUF329 family)